MNLIVEGSTHYSRRSLCNHQDFIRFSHGFHLLYVRSICYMSLQYPLLTCLKRQERVCNVQAPIKSQMKNGKKRVEPSVKQRNTVRPTGNFVRNGQLSAALIRPLPMNGQT